MLEDEPSWSVAREAPGERDQVLALNRAAFGGEVEAEIIERLTADELVAVSLVARENGGVVGHIMFSDLDVRVDGRLLHAASLAPMAVAPTQQRRGIGSSLVRAGLAAMRAGAYDAVIVLGHPEFYSRFGFTAHAVARMKSPFQGHEAFMGIALTLGALDGAQSDCRYPAAFGLPG